LVIVTALLGLQQVGQRSYGVNFSIVILVID
jgi:hypothetical protein